jgi:hypothetical protein
MPNGSRVKTSVGWLFVFKKKNLQLQSYENLDIVDSGFYEHFQNQPTSGSSDLKTLRIKESDFF